MFGLLLASLLVGSLDTFEVPTAFPLVTPAPGADEIAFCAPRLENTERLTAVVFVRRDGRYVQRDLILVTSRNDPNCPGPGGAVSLRAARAGANAVDTVVVGIFSQVPGPTMRATAANGVRGTTVGFYLRPLLYFGIRGAAGGSSPP